MERSTVQSCLAAPVFPIKSESRASLTCDALFFGFPLLEEIDTNFLAIDPGQFAAPIGKAGRRKQQEELLEVQFADCSLDSYFGPVFGNIQQAARTTPRPVDRHHVGVVAPLEHDAFAKSSLLRCHR